jgi:mono/diheme cytochrome c family protein
MTMRRLLLLLLLAAAPACAGLALPGPLDAERAQARYPKASVQSLTEGRQLFVSRCSGCHTLPRPTAHGPSEWPSVIGEMARDAKLDPAQRELVEQYLVTMSAGSH